MTLSRWCPAEGLAAGHRVQPWSQPLRVAELPEPLGRDQERVLGGVGRLLAVAALRFSEISPFGTEKVDDIDPGDELLDVVDEQDRVVGQATRREVRHKRLLHRFSSVLCRDGAGRLYVHRRTDDKDVYPGMYDMTAGGVLAAGETYLEGARRELAEELGVVGPEPRFLFRHRYRGRENPSWSALFEVTWDGPVTPQASEIAWGAFLTLEELAVRLEQWPFCPDGLEIFRRWQVRTGAATPRPKRR